MPSAANNYAVFLDRDGTIIEDTGYPSGSEPMKLLDGVSEAISTLNRAGFKVIVITNQSGVGRGYFDVNAVDEFHAILDERLALSGARIDAYYSCLHAPDENGNPACNCRKPRNGLFHRAELDFGIDLKHSYLVGDKPSDVEAGKSAGCTAIQLTRDEVILPGASFYPDYVAIDLPMAVKWIINRENINDRHNSSLRETGNN